MFSDPHIGFVVAAYAVAFAVIAGMIGAVVLDYRRLAPGSPRPTGRSRRRAAPRALAGERRA